MTDAQCKPGSAWEEWQKAGRQWLADNRSATRKEAEQAAANFAALPGWPQAALRPRARAFMQGASPLQPRVRPGTAVSGADAASLMSPTARAKHTTRENRAMPVYRVAVTETHIYKVPAEDADQAEDIASLAHEAGNLPPSGSYHGVTYRSAEAEEDE